MKLFFCKKSSLCCFLAFALLFSAVIPARFASAEGNDFVLVLDPGHGYAQLGATFVYDDELVCEKDLNLKIARYLKESLEKLKTADGRNIKVYLTHNGDLTSNLFLPERVEIGALLDAEAVISIHNNYSAPPFSATGSMVLLTHSHYKPSGCRFSDLYEIEEGLSNCILLRLGEIGLDRAHDINPDNSAFIDIIPSSEFIYENGLLRRFSDDGSTYENGDITDWYGINYQGSLRGIPAIIVEHAYLNNSDDYYKYLSTNAQLKLLAEADSKGIADYYGLCSSVF